MKQWLLHRRNERWIAVALASICLALYVPTVCPTVTFTDNGELATVAVTMGVAHPTGYPIFTLLGRLASMIPLSLPMIYTLNLFAAVVTAAAMGLFFLVVREIQRVSFFAQPSRHKNTASQPLTSLMAAMGATLVLGFSSTVWSQATSLEVYALHILLVLATILFFLRGLQEQTADEGVTSRNLLAFSFVLGLSFANHMTTILLAPGFLYLYFSVLGWSRASIRRLAVLAPPFFGALSIYAVLWVRALVHPPLDWGNVESLQRLFWHVSGKQYRVWMFEGWGVAKKQLGHAVENFSSEFGYATWFFLLLGIASVVSNRKRGVFVGLLFSSCVLYAINYDIHDIDSYFLLAFLATAFILSFGLETAFDVLVKWNKRASVVLMIACGVVVTGAQVVDHRGSVNASHDQLASAFAEESLQQLPQNAIVISGLWDYFVSPMYYFQRVEGRRPDITVIDKSLLQNRVWYFSQLKATHPEVYRRSESEIRSFLVELNKFEQGIPFQFAMIQMRWNELLESLVRSNAGDHPVFVDWRIQSEFSPAWKRVPNGFFVKLAADTTLAELPYWEVVYKEPVSPNDFSNDLKQYYLQSLAGNVEWLRRHGENELVERYLRTTKAIAPNFGQTLERSLKGR